MALSARRSKLIIRGRVQRKGRTASAARPNQEPLRSGKKLASGAGALLLEQLLRTIAQHVRLFDEGFTLVDIVR